MSTIRRIFVEKKDAFAVEAHGLLSDLRNNLGMKNLTGIRILNRYDVMGVSDEEFAAARKIVLSEPPVDTVTDEIFEVPASCCAFAVEYLPGQYDQREDFAEQAIQLITQKERPMVASAKIYILEGNLTEAELAKIKSYCINP
ncbi:phosphoribosylformylglycinamidine synthase, partial [Sellimonas intestinalis]|nr:phosphoribosylformylglycinamidine synthase [Sellimonas intestinalis]